ncbi:MAG: hypothetical protein IJ833_04675, partial [Lachnospiraceae bacterium]|nr:hypothetical protein [Lachnospiraceae bacterium]
VAYMLEPRISAERDAEYKGLLAKLYIEEAEYEEANKRAQIWEEALKVKLLQDETDEEREKDEDRIRQSHMIRMECYRMMAHGTKAIQEGESRKYFEVAISEAEKIETHTMKDVSLYLEKAQVYMEMEEYEQCLEVCRVLIERYRIYAAFATQLEVYRRQWDAGGVIRVGQQCVNAFPGYAKAYEYMAKVYLDLGRKEDLQKVLDDAEHHQVESVLLEAYRYQLTEQVPEIEVLNQKIKEFRKHYMRRLDNGYLSSYEEGLPIITEYLYWYPGTYMLVERGLFHRAAHKLDKAQEDFEKALAENPYHPYALSNLSVVYKYRGEFDKALVCLNKAIRYYDEDMMPGLYSDISTVYSLLGDHDKALEYYQRYMEQCDASRQQDGKNTLVELLLRCGKVEEAEEELLSSFGGRVHGFYKYIVNKLQQVGAFDRAEVYLRKWSEMLGAEKGVLLRKLGGKANVTSDMLADYYLRKGWQCLLCGKTKDAPAYFDKAYVSRKKRTDMEGDLADSIFVCILCEDEKRGRKFAGLLQDWMKVEKQNTVSKYYDMQKAFLHIRFMAGYYTLSDDEIESILRQEKDAEICYFCDKQVCWELESARILFLWRIGKKQEAAERLKRYQGIPAQGDYMLAMKRLLGVLE